MITLRKENGLLFVDAYLTFNGKILYLPKALVDTGSMGTLVSLERAQEIDLKPEPTDSLHRVFGVGGTEFVIAKQVESFGLGIANETSLSIADFSIELGSLDYGLDLDAIVGLDILCDVGAIIDLQNNEILGKL
jgi:hypothetical protein